MKKNTMDPRTARTKQLLLDAMLDIMEEHGASAITVKKLTEKAELNRGTFYLHYHDVPDLLEQCKSEMLKGLKKSEKESKMVSENEQESGLVRMFEYMAEHRRFFQIMLSPKGDSTYMQQMKSMVGEKIKTVFKYFPAKDQVMGDYRMTYLSSAVLGIVSHWFDQGMNLSPNEMALIVIRLAENVPASI